MICATSPGQSCDSVGTWLITFARDAGREGNCSGGPAPPEIDLRLSAPGQLRVSAEGCELSYQHIEPWLNETEC
ncbi:MAG TPA: hypothetical protein VJR89_14730, partial [Polyangiales bacterium]|nr:hypothetical protein [Polyangiales bacterium]